jgi:hypothetical protein
MAFSRRMTLLYPPASMTNGMKDAVANAYVTHAALETFANERAMFDKAAPLSSDYGTTETHRAISSAMTPALAAAIKTALAGMAGNWYLVDANSGALLDTNDTVKKPGATVTKQLVWQPGVALALNETVTYQGQSYAVIQAHTSQSDWTPDIAAALFKRYIAPGQVTAWRQPQGAHDAYPVGARVTDGGKTWKNVTPANVWKPGSVGAETLWTDESAPVVGAWAFPVAYNIGDRVTYGGLTYSCRQSHTSQAGWQPPNVPALWLAV